MASRPVLDREQTRKAVSALLKYIGKEKAEAKELFDDDEFLYLVCLPFDLTASLVEPLMSRDRLRDFGSASSNGT